MNKLSGPEWVMRFPGSTVTRDLRSPFRESVDQFLTALRTAGAQVTISATFRPPERAWLMHWSWKIDRRRVRPEDVPPMAGVNIQWVHQTADASIQAATAMVNAYGMSRLHVAPALRSRHTEGHAIDMSIAWQGNLTIKDKNGNDVVINTPPSTGMNAGLHRVGQSYGVIKFHGGDRDKPHWSIDGR